MLMLLGFLLMLMGTPVLLLAQSPSLDQSSTLPAFTMPRDFCQSLAQGTYCSLSGGPREFIHCPSSVPSQCPLGTTCRQQGSGGIECLPDPALESTQICQALANVTTDTRIQSLCLGDGQSMVECPLGRVYPCPPDLWCQRRGLRAYCVPPALTRIPPDNVQSCGQTPATKNTQESNLICDVLNLRKQVDCAKNTSSLCPTGTICTVSSANNGSLGDGGNATAGQAVCRPWTEDLPRFCSNKPLWSSFCVPGAKGDRSSPIWASYVVCGGVGPFLARCPVGNRCRQQLSITAHCLPDTGAEQDTEAEKAGHVSGLDGGEVEEEQQVVNTSGQDGSVVVVRTTVWAEVSVGLVNGTAKGTDNNPTKTIKTDSEREDGDGSGNGTDGGNVSGNRTLATQDANGEWVLLGTNNTVPDLADLSKVLLRVNGEDATPVSTDANSDNAWETLVNGLEGENQLASVIEEASGDGDLTTTASVTSVVSETVYTSTYTTYVPEIAQATPVTVVTSAGGSSSTRVSNTNNAGSSTWVTRQTSKTRETSKTRGTSKTSVTAATPMTPSTVSTQVTTATRVTNSVSQSTYERTWDLGYENSGPTVSTSSAVSSAVPTPPTFVDGSERLLLSTTLLVRPPTSRVFNDTAVVEAAVANLKNGTVAGNGNRTAGSGNGNLPLSVNEILQLTPPESEGNVTVGIEPVTGIPDFLRRLVGMP